MSSTHTNEPWRAERGRVIARGYTVATCCGPGGIDEDDARRIVACVNACAGIPTEALEAGAVVLRDKRFHIEATEPRA